MIFKIIVASIIALVIIVRLIFTLVERNEYAAWIHDVKTWHEYQTIDLDTLIKVYKSLGNDRFSVDSGTSPYKGKPDLLWYRVTRYDTVLVDIPWLSYKKFMRLKKKLDRRQNELDNDVLRSQHSTNRALMDAQKRLERIIEDNLSSMRNAAEQQKDIIDRIQIVV